MREIRVLGKIRTANFAILSGMVALSTPGWAETAVAPTPQVNVAPAPAPSADQPTTSTDGGETPVFAPDTPLEPVTDLPASPAPQIDAITLFPNQGELSSSSGFNDQRFGYVLHGSVKASYESNIFIRPTNEQADFIFRISPAVAVGFGDFKGEVMGASKFGDLFERYLGKSYIFADYRPSWEMFLDHSDQDSFDHDVAVVGELMLQKLSLGLRARYRTENTPDEDLGTRDKQARISAAITSEYLLTGKTSLEANGYLETRDYEDKARGDNSREWKAEGWINYQALPKINFSVGGTLGWIERTDGVSEKFQQALFRVRYRATQNLTFGVSAGPQFRQVENGRDDTDGVFAASLAWSPAPTTYFSLQAFRRTVPAGSRGGTYTGTTVQLQFRKLLFQHFYFGLGTGYRYADYDGLPGTADYGREDDLYFLRPSVGFIVNQWLNCELSGEYRTNDSTNPSREFDATILALQFNVIF